MHLLPLSASLNVSVHPAGQFCNCPTPTSSKSSPILENLNFGSLLQTKHLNKEPSQRWGFLFGRQTEGKEQFCMSGQCFQSASTQACSKGAQTWLRPRR